jgi:hypothetical protein
MSSAIAIDPQSSTSNPQAAAYLCSKCQYIFDHWAEAMQHNLSRNQDDFCDHHDIFALETSARMGCILCKRFLDSITAMDLKALNLETQRHPDQRSRVGRIWLSRLQWEHGLGSEFRKWVIYLWHSNACLMSVHLSPISQIKSMFRSFSLASIRHRLILFSLAKVRH